jgi:hypothetical protein
MRNFLSHLLALLKWPVALAMLLLLLPASATLARALWQMAEQPQSWWPLGAGLLCFALLWMLWLRHATEGHWLYALEHELTHALFAVLTFNKVTDLNAARGTGHLAYEGRGNWLISLAPYFFPTFCVLPLLALQFAVAAAQPWLLGLLGFCLGMHLHGSAIETHWHQPDLERYGRLASWCIVPGAMVCTLVLILAALPGQSGAVLALARETWVLCGQWLLGAGHWVWAWNQKLGP